MTRVILDDHLLRDLLADDVPRDLARVLRSHEPATTNLYLYRLSRSVTSSRGGSLTGAWNDQYRRALGARLVSLPESIDVVPIRTISYRMAELATEHRVSTLGAECVAASEYLAAPLCVWSGDDGPGIRAAMAQVGLDYRIIHR